SEFDVLPVDMSLTRRQFIKRGVEGGVAFSLATSIGGCRIGCGGPGPRNEMGRWNLLPEQLNMVPIHAAVLRTGDVLFWGPDLTRDPDHPPGSPSAWPYINDMKRVQIALFNPKTGQGRTLAMTNPRNLFCAGQCFLPDGRL